MPPPLRFLVAESGSPSQRARRRESVGLSSGESYGATLRALVPDAECDRVKPADGGATLPGAASIADYDAVFLTGSPLHLYEDSVEVRRELDFMRAVFASGTPSFGSCAGLQVAAAAAGGSVRPNRGRQEAGFARQIRPTAAGRSHPLLRGRPSPYEAPTIHADEVESLPAGATLLASNARSRVQAAEIRHREGVFWGVQYHPELSLREIAAALRRDAEGLLRERVFNSREALERYARAIECLEQYPERDDIAARLRVGREVTDPVRRSRELRNFVEALVRPLRARRGRG